MHWVLLIALSILAGGWLGRSGSEDEASAQFKRLSPECRAELELIARDEPPTHGDQH
jgi:hypothetical protein